MLKRKKAQAFTAPKDKTTKAIVKKNATSPLLGKVPVKFQSLIGWNRMLCSLFTGGRSLHYMLQPRPLARGAEISTVPIEVRERIWGYVLGNCTVHIKFAASHRWEPDWRSRGRGQACYSFSGRFFYILCEAAASEQDGYRLSKSADYDLSVQGVGCDDVRLSSKRHSACYSCYNDCLDAPAYRFGDQYVGGPKDPQKLAQNRISISVLRVCRQVYVEANQLLWRTTTWSFAHALAFSVDAETALGS